MPQEKHLVLWRNLHAPGAEYCMLARASGSWELTGTIVTTLAERPVQATYTVSCSRNWEMQAVMVILTEGDVARSKVWTVDKNQRWYEAGDEVKRLRDCSVVDIGLTPATNTIPIRRWQLEVGQTKEITAAWITFPDLEIKKSKQQYTRIADNRYHYESATATAELEVDEHGLVITYEGGWERTAAAPGSR